MACITEIFSILCLTMLFSTITLTKFFLTILVGFICISGDRLVDKNKNHPLLKAVSDNVTHGLIGLFSYLIVMIEYRTSVSISELFLLVGAGFIVSCGIDLDHFIMARSWKLVVSSVLVDFI